MSREARETLERAKKSGDYIQYARAVFGFGEALRLWPDNGAANLGLTMARKAYAEAALERGEFDLALSQSQHLPRDKAGALAERAEAGKAERDNRQKELERHRAVLGSHEEEGGLTIHSFGHSAAI